MTDVIRFAFRNISLWMGLEIGKPSGQLYDSPEEGVMVWTKALAVDMEEKK